MTFSVGGAGREIAAVASGVPDAEERLVEAAGTLSLRSLQEECRLCRWHHHTKTFLGYTYRGGPGTWEWLAPEDRDIDLSPLRRIITTARRC